MNISLTQSHKNLIEQTNAILNPQIELDEAKKETFNIPGEVLADVFMEVLSKYKLKSDLGDSVSNMDIRITGDLKQLVKFAKDRLDLPEDEAIEQLKESSMSVGSGAVSGQDKPLAKPLKRLPEALSSKDSLKLKNNIKKMTIEQAIQLGRDQFKAGMTFRKANVRPPGFLAAALVAGRNDLIDALDAGWHQENAKS